jgi:hypothetical protein
VPDNEERFWYPSTATTVIARRLVPVLLFTLGVGLFLRAGIAFYNASSAWTLWPPLLLGAASWAAAGYFLARLPEVRADAQGLRVRRLAVAWRRIPWTSVAGVRQTGRIDLLGWNEPFYTLFVWRSRIGRHGRVRRDWHRREARGFRFSGHIRNCDRLLELIRQHLPPTAEETHEPSAEAL